MHSTIRVLFSLLLSVATVALVAPRANAHQTVEYERRELTIPVRDGVKLFAIALIPRGMREPLPILLTRTPFSAAGAFRSGELPGRYRELGQDGYI